MAQHKASNSRTLRSAMRHKAAADSWLDDGINAIQGEGAVLVKMNADANGTWDTDYVAEHGTPLYDTDNILLGQYKRTLREIMIGSLAHKNLANKICNTLEEISVSYNAVLAQMDADGGTLSNDATYEAFRIKNEDLLSGGQREGGQHQATTTRSLRSALSHRDLANKLIDDMAALQKQVNDMIDIVQAAN